MKVWVYPTHENYYIVKRRPFQYVVVVSDPIDGGTSYRIIQGNEVECPQWDQVERSHGVTWATFQNKVYDISDLRP